MIKVMGTLNLKLLIHLCQTALQKGFVFNIYRKQYTFSLVNIKMGYYNLTGKKRHLALLKRFNTSICISFVIFQFIILVHFKINVFKITDLFKFSVY